MSGGKGSDFDISGRNVREAIRLGSEANQSALSDFALFSQLGQQNPFGSISFTGEIGSPDRRQVTEFSPEIQPIFSGLLGIGQNLAGTPLSFSGLPEIPGQDDLLAGSERASQAVFDRGINLLQPEFDRARSRLEADLSNRGIPLNSEAAQEALNRLDRSQGQQLENLALSSVGAGGQEQSRLFGLGLSGRQQGINEILTQRSQPIQELAAVLSGAQGNVPQFSPIASQGTQAVNPAAIEGLRQQSQQSRLGRGFGFQQDLLGGLFGLGGAGIGAGILGF